ncbi:family 43 glycosylhydrolase [Paenibacillus methanolicus]|uniref:Glycosyl hydrolase family 43 n=1 Tax=Paenibacillus methanolicus TaxID=582686 RepID=A0A5S5C1Q1_9BACL|nr:cohesin domain-containing protein [Paenibacillus methanolicus]TYP73099.1 glycosyl hydrolase family 43 [Paenibacillus methanolicus]
MFLRKKVTTVFLASTLVASASAAFTPAIHAEDAADLAYTEQQMKDNDDIVYFVNAGDPSPLTLEIGDKLGLYASRTEQAYGMDLVTGKKWGYATATTGTNVTNASSKNGSLRYYNGAQVRSKAIQYRFELPADRYDITLGFQNPWSGRSVNILVEGSNVSGGDYDIGSYGALKEVTYSAKEVSDGELNLDIQGPATAALTNHNDPLVSYIIVRKHVTIPISDLRERIDAAELAASNPIYTTYSVSLLRGVIAKAEALVTRVTEDGVDVVTVQDEIRSVMLELDAAEAALAPLVTHDSYTPGTVWTDTNGAPIQAHGGGVLFDEPSQTYYWYGEDKTNGYLPARGIRVYSSKDLYNWKDEGLALTAIESMDQFKTDPLISSLYAGRTDQADIFNDIGTQRIMERPKVIFNDKTNKYVMWLHTDGPSATSNANYAKAEAGYALSDSPTGPFVYGVSNRMDRVPPGASYDGQPDQPGMARDMNLFKDDDGTAYLIYSSEENMTIYISKLNESYTDVVGWHKDGLETRDTTYKAEYGVDYIRVFPGAQREAPAMFKYDGKYYLITSGATGWAPNRAQYTVADSIFGEWKTMRDPSIGEKASTTFDSQSTNVIPVDPAKGKFIYMGDRWNSNDLKNSRYVWLPIEFGQQDEIALKWYDEWKLEDLDRMGRVTLQTSIPQKATVGHLPQLPAKVKVIDTSGQSKETAVAWTLNEAEFSRPGYATITGRLTDLSNKEVRFSLTVLPDNVLYLVHAGGAATDDYALWSSYMQHSLVNKSVIDQAYDPANGKSWGYVGTGTSPSGSNGGNMFTALRYLKANNGDDLTYKFDIPDGSYTVYVGLYDPWYASTKGSRKANILINGEVKTSGYVFTDAYDSLGYEHVNVTGGPIDVTVRRVAGSPDPQISWIMIVDENTSAELEGADQANAGQTFELTYGLDQVEGDQSKAYAQELTIQYDPSLLELVKAESLKENVIIAGQSDTPGSVRLLLAGVDSEHGIEPDESGSLVRLTFRAAASSPNSVASVSVTGVILANGAGEERSVTGDRHDIRIVSLEKQSLERLIADAQTLHDGAPEGTKAGQYKKEVREAFQAAINAASAVAADPSATQARIDQAVSTLQTAMDTFRRSVNTATPGDINEDNRFTIGDLAIIASHYGETPSSHGWLASADQNRDAVIDILDLSIVAQAILNK